ncbi:MAG: HEAT repeat domain-containing protein [Planctomycetes bacterium]|nr:HEAT repeat domain-containing protein [Planctomycetota bacterium]
MTARTTSFSLALAALFAACQKPASKTPAPPAFVDPPPPALQPHQAELERLASGGPHAPDATHLHQYVEMCELAFGADNSDRRLAARSAAALRDEASARWGLEEALTHADPAVRIGALDVLGELGLQASLPPLLMRLKYELDPQPRLAVLRALARLGNGAGLAELVASFARPDLAQNAGVYAIEILRLAGKDPGEAPSWEQLGAAVTELADEWATTGAVRSLPAPKAEPELLTVRLARHLAALNGFQLRPVDDTRFVLSRAGTLGLELLRPCLLAEEPYLRSHGLEIARQLGVVGAPLADAVHALLGDKLTRAEAVRTLGRLRAVQFAPLVRERLHHPDFEVRCAAAGALGPIGDRDAIPELQRLMNDAATPMDLRVQAAFSLAVFELQRPGYRFLQQHLQAGDYHEPTLRELIDAVDRWR